MDCLVQKDAADLFKSIEENGNVQLHSSKNIPDEANFSIYN